MRTTTVTVALIACLVGTTTGTGVTAAASAGNVSRTVRAPYYGPAVAVSAPSGYITAHCHPGFSIGCVQIPTTARDRFVRLKVDDVSGQAVFVMVLDGYDNELGFVCSATRPKIPVPGSSYIEVWLLSGTCAGTTTPSIATVGEVVATFTQR